jgi:DNA-binding transcriptional MocR family regulator
MTVATRRALVRQLKEQDSTLSARNIADQIGVGKDTVLRDLRAIETAQRQPAPEPPPAEPEHAPQDDRIVLVLDAPLRQALAILRAQVRQPDTPDANAKAARAAIRAVADHIHEEQQHQEGSRP